MVLPNMGTFKKKPILKAISPGVPSLDWKQLIKFCRMPTKSFEQFGKKFNTPDGPFYFKDNGADILGVCHLDYVIGPLHASTLKLSDDTLFFCPTLDDRAGAYALLDYLPKAGVKFDLLLTTGEEKLRSTAAYFNPPKKYKYIFSFDRAGTDVVMYDYETTLYEKILKNSGWTLGKGTYSDIVDLEHLRCKGFNFGVGYSLQHTTRCHLSKMHFMENMRKFLTFYKNNIGINMVHTPMWNSYSREDGFSYNYIAGSTVYQDTFTENDIEAIETLEKQGYNFPRKVTKENLDIISKDFSSVNEGEELANMRKSLDNVERARRAQITLDFKEIVDGNTKATDAIQSKKITKIVNLPLIHMSDVKVIKGSEDNPTYNTNKTRKSEEQILDNRNPEPSSTIVHSGVNGRKGMAKIVGIADGIGIASMGFDECTQCHELYEVKSCDLTTHCPECRQKEVLMTDVESKLIKMPIGTIIHLPILITDEVTNGKSEYKQDSQGRWSWQKVRTKTEDRIAV